MNLRLPTPLKVLGIFLALYFFLVGIGALSTAFKMMGKDVSQELLGTQAGPLVSLFIGILATTLMQSSSTTTSIVVGMVASNVLPLESAVYMVMGANVGTTVTNTLVSLGHMNQTAEYRRAFAAATVHDFFNIIVLLVVFPIEVATGWVHEWAGQCMETFRNVGGVRLADPIKLVTKPAIEFLKGLVHESGYWLVAVALVMTFMALYWMVKLLKSLMLNKLENLFDRLLFRTPVRGLIFGLLLTILVQSSSISTSVAVPLVGAGVLTIHQVFPYTMGANIGTTCTGLLAALGAIAGAGAGEVEAHQALAGLTLAFFHVLFNLIGVALLWWFRWLPITIAEKFAAVAVRNRLIPVVYILVAFYLIPALVIWIGRR